MEKTKIIKIISVIACVIIIGFILKPFIEKKIGDAKYLKMLKENYPRQYCYEKFGDSYNVPAMCKQYFDN